MLPSPDEVDPTAFQPEEVKDAAGESNSINMGQELSMFATAGATNQALPATKPGYALPQQKRAVRSSARTDYLGNDTYSGNEWAIEIKATEDGLLRAKLYADNPLLNVFILEGSADTLRENRLISWGIERTTVVAKTDGIYTIVVDGYDGALGEFELAVAFATGLPVQPDVTIGCDMTVPVVKSEILRFESPDSLDVAFIALTPESYSTVLATPVTAETPWVGYDRESVGGVLELTIAYGNVWYLAQADSGTLQIECTELDRDKALLYEHPGGFTPSWLTPAEQADSTEP